MRFCDKGALQPPLTQSLQMMRFEPHEEDPNLNIFLQSGIRTWDDKGKQPKESTWVHKALIKEPKFDLECNKETIMEDNKSFIKASTSKIKDGF